jgi:hypothetical protein
MCFGDQGINITHRTEHRIYGTIIHHFFAQEIICKENGSNPQASYTEFLQVGKPHDDARYVANSVTVRILKTSRKDFIGYASLPPSFLIHHQYYTSDETER